MLHFDDAAALHSIMLVDHHELHSHLPEGTQRAPRPFASRVPVRHNNKPLTIHLEPDVGECCMHWLLRFCDFLANNLTYAILRWQMLNSLLDENDSLENVLHILVHRSSVYHTTDG
jgi:hypothetical protein